MYAITSNGLRKQGLHSPAYLFADKRTMLLIRQEMDNQSSQDDTIGVGLRFKRVHAIFDRLNHSSSLRAGLDNRTMTDGRVESIRPAGGSVL